MNFVYYLHDERSSEQFERFLLKIRSKYNIVSTDVLYNNLRDGRHIKNTCCLTVDDGWVSTYEVIFPLVKKYNVPITIFVSPKSCKTGYNFWFYLIRFCNLDKLRQSILDLGCFNESVLKYPVELILKELDLNTIYSLITKCIDGNKYESIPRGFINTEELLEMHSSGLVTVGAHTLNHPILANESDEVSCYEIQESISDLSNLINEPIRYFAFPNGLLNVDFGKREIATIKEAGIQMAFSVDSNVITKNVDLFSIPRICSEKRLGLGRIGAILPSLSNQKGKRKSIRKLKYSV